MPFGGTLLNTATVLVGSLIGLGFGHLLPERVQGVAILGIGVVTLILGVKMALGTQNVLVLASSVALGGIAGALLGLDAHLLSLATWVKQSVGGQGAFTEGLITATVLFCVGPMTLIGCIQDGLERKSELLVVKSMMDGVTSVFLAATLGVGVLFSALAVLLIQGALTSLARLLEPVAKRPALLAEASAAGGAVLLVMSVSILELREARGELFLPALVLAPAFAAAAQRLGGREAQA